MVIEEYQVIPKKIYFDDLSEGEWFVLADDIELEMPIMAIYRMGNKTVLKLGIDYDISNLWFQKPTKVYRVQIKSIQFRFLNREGE